MSVNITFSSHLSIAVILKYFISVIRTLFSKAKQTLDNFGLCVFNKAGLSVNYCLHRRQKNSHLFKFLALNEI